MSTPAAIMASIFAGCEGLIEIRAIFPNKTVHQEYFHDPGAAARCADAYNGRANVYIGAATRLRKSGTKDDVQEIGWLWGDCDSPEAVANIRTFPLSPTMEIQTSEGRRHVWWRLKEPLLVEDERTIFKVESVLRGIASVLRSDPSVAEVARVLRFPGTMNLKRNSQVTLLYDDGPHYELDDFINLGIYRESKETAASGNGHEPEGTNWIADLLHGVDEPGRNAACTRLAGYILRREPEDVARAQLLNFAAVCRPPLEPAEVERVIKSIKLAIERESASTSQETEPDPEVATWPAPPKAMAYYGILGDIVLAVEPHTEADPIAILAQSVVAFGNCVGGTPYFPVEGNRHRVSEFLVMVGPTAGGRKGSAWDRARGPFASADDVWERERVMGGLSSGEGLIDAVRDAIEEQQPVKEKGRITGYQTVVTDPGVGDKRLLVFESEFSRVLQVAQRDGSTLSTTVRQAWDGSNLRVMTRGSKLRATGAHISIIGHITQDELLRQLEKTEAASGFGNRFLWLCVKRSKFLPEGGNIGEVDFAPLLKKLKDAVLFARQVGEMRRDSEARKLWREEYQRLSTGRPGLLGAMLGRAEAHVVRLSMIYALADCSREIQRPHLEAALAMWDYCERSCKFIFGDKLGDPTADELLRALRAAPAGLTRTDMTAHFDRNKSSAEIGRALGALSRQGLARMATPDRTGERGRPSQRWTAVGSEGS